VVLGLESMAWRAELERVVHDYFEVVVVGRRGSSGSCGGAPRDRRTAAVSRRQLLHWQYRLAELVSRYDGGESGLGLELLDLSWNNVGLAGLAAEETAVHR
jgi:hypothetical protein